MLDRFDGLRITPSSAATTSTTTSVTLAPGAHGREGGMTGYRGMSPCRAGLHVVGTHVLGDTSASPPPPCVRM